MEIRVTYYLDQRIKVAHYQELTRKAPFWMLSGIDRRRVGMIPLLTSLLPYSLTTSSTSPRPALQKLQEKKRRLGVLRIPQTPPNDLLVVDGATDVSLARLRALVWSGCV